MVLHIPHLNSRLKKNNTVIVKMKEQNLAYFSSVNLYGHLEFLFVFKI